ncbi:8-oxo-dGTP diphosphatase MutT [bacterium]|nr:8-oxo-dGTP diphosphatase MutT [bacterium]
MTIKPEVEVAAGIIWRRDGRILISKRPDDIDHGGYWELPGGKLEDGETPERALEREVYEEMGVHIQSHSLFTSIRHSYPHLIVNLHVIHARFLSGNPQLLEVSDTAWILPEEISNYTFPAADEQLFQMDWQKPPFGLNSR